MIKKIKIIVAFGLVASIAPLLAMEKEKEQSSLETTQELSLVDKLPDEIWHEIIKYLVTLDGITRQSLVTADGETRHEKLKNAVKNIRKLLLVNKKLASFLDDVPLAQYLIEKLSHYDNSNDYAGKLVCTSAALGTRGAGHWLAQYSNQSGILDIIKR